MSAFFPVSQLRRIEIIAHMYLIGLNISLGDRFQFSSWDGFQETASISKVDIHAYWVGILGKDG